MKRAKRRQRHLLKQRLRELDAIALKEIRKSYNLFMASWGGTKCPGCEQNIRPYMLIDCNFSCTFLDENNRWAHLDGFTYPCDKVKNCPGEK